VIAISPIAHFCIVLALINLVILFFFGFPCEVTVANSSLYEVSIRQTCLVLLFFSMRPARVELEPDRESIC
jgi:hypothetical protein